ncbi:hypothetical protein [Carnobacterium mobile]|uniref:hypothetical protein n=1 Tax=Carnobacterium mobile TaxID=2750 RepID=UPI001866699C|nr:hypothetical protein [Carnobacterium mobile]
MNKKILLVYAMLFFILGGCSNISEDKAKKIIVEEYSNQLGEATILSTEEKNDDYYIEWENKNDKSKGISKVSSNGEITLIELEIE